MNEDEAPTTALLGQQAADAPDAFPRRGPLRAILTWAVLWLVLIGGVAALFTYSEIRDDAWRAKLTSSGLCTRGMIVNDEDARRTAHGKNCGKGAHAIVRFQTNGNSARSRCVTADALPHDYVRYVFHCGLPPAVIGIVYDAHDASKFIVTAPDGSVPRRALAGIWHRWFTITASLLALYCTVTTIILIHRDRRQ
jgi:hypothetical protein